MRATSTIKTSLFCLILIQSTISFGTPSHPSGTAPLIFPHVEQLSSHLAKVTARLNPLLNPSRSYNIGIFTLGYDLMTNCETYAEYDGCYFTNITTESTITFLVVGNFTDGLTAEAHAILVVFSILPPENTQRSPSVSLAGINYPKTSAATIEFFPFDRIM